MLRTIIAGALVACMQLPAIASDDSAARRAGRTVTEFGQGVAEQLLAPMVSSVPRQVVEIIEPRPKDDCITESGGVIDKRYMRCRNGAQLTWRVMPDGRRELIREQPLPTN